MTTPHDTKKAPGKAAVDWAAAFEALDSAPTSFLAAAQDAWRIRVTKERQEAMQAAQAKAKPTAQAINAAKFEAADQSEYFVVTRNKAGELSIEGVMRKLPRQRAGVMRDLDGEYRSVKTDGWSAIVPDVLAVLSKDGQLRSKRLFVTRNGNEADALALAAKAMQVQVTRNAEAEQRSKDKPQGYLYTVAHCRREMSKHHPDKGGDSETFRAWQAAFKRAKEREQQS